MSSIDSTKPAGCDSGEGLHAIRASKPPIFPALDDDLPTLDTSVTLSRLTPLDLALKSSLTTPAPGCPDVTIGPAETARELQYYRNLLARRPDPYHAFTPEQLDGKTFKWLVLDLTYQETLEREVEKFDILCDEQILTTLWKGSGRDREIIARDIDKRKGGFRKRIDKSVEEAAVVKARTMKVEEEGWDNEMTDEEREELMARARAE